MIHCCVCSIILIYLSSLCSRSVVWSVLCERLLMVPTWASVEMSWESPPKPQPLWSRRAQNISLWSYSHCLPVRQRINIFCQAHFGDGKLLPGEMVGLAHSQTESPGKSKELPPNHLNLAQKSALLVQCHYPRIDSNSMQLWEYFSC